MGGPRETRHDCWNPIGMKPTLQPATAADLDRVVAFMREFYAIDGYPFNADVAREALTTLVTDPSPRRVWLIGLATDWVGYVVITFGFSLEYHGRDAFVDELFFLPAYRGKGLGATMAFGEAACQKLGVQALHLEVERDNGAGQALYRGRGFKGNDRQLLTKWLMPERAESKESALSPVR